MDCRLQKFRIFLHDLAGIARFILALGFAAVLILGFAILAAWARSGYFVAFNDDDQVVIYQGRQDSVLWFDPTQEAIGPYGRDELDDASIALVEERKEFESQASAEVFVAERLTPTTTEPPRSTTRSTATSTTTSTTTPSTTATGASGRGTTTTTQANG